MKMGEDRNKKDEIENEHEGNKRIIDVRCGGSSVYSQDIVNDRVCDVKLGHIMPDIRVALSLRNMLSLQGKIVVKQGDKIISTRKTIMKAICTHALRKCGYNRTYNGTFGMQWQTHACLLAMCRLLTTILPSGPTQLLRQWASHGTFGAVMLRIKASSVATRRSDRADATPTLVASRNAVAWCTQRQARNRSSTCRITMVRAYIHALTYAYS